MTGAERPWSLPVRVELSDDSVIQLEETGQAGVRFSPSQIDRLFEAGLMQTPRTTERDLAVPAGVTLTGNARFLVGEVDLGVERGMEVVVRGLEAAVDAVTRGYRDSDPLAEPAEEEPAAYDPDEGGAERVREIRVPIDQAGDRLDDLLGEIERGIRVVLVQDGTRVAVLTTWSYYVELREKLAAASVAFWSAWRRGVFDVAGYATDVTTILHGPGAKAGRVPGDDEEDLAEGARRR